MPAPARTILLGLLVAVSPVGLRASRLVTAADAPAPTPAGPPTPEVAPVADARHVHVVLVGDTEAADVGESVQNDLRSMRNALSDGLPAGRRTIEEVVGSDARPATILARVHALPAGPGDAVVVYYAGHGAWADAGPYLRPGGQVLPRAELVAAMQSKGPRLAVLLTDACGTYVGETYLYRARVPDPSVFRDLFVRARGLVDVNAASRGQVAVGDRALGGYFTQALVGLLEGTPRGELDGDRDGVVSWREAVAHVTAATSAVFSRGQPRGLAVEGKVLRGQTPVILSNLPPPSPRVPPASRRLGTRTTDAGGGGARVLGVDPDSPAAWIGLGEGDVVMGVRVPGAGPEDDVRPTRTAAALRAVLVAIGGETVVALQVLRARAPAGASPDEVWVRLGP